jgi:3-methylcrotonyl-CoA carboxylase alpha subunit
VAARLRISDGQREWLVTVTGTQVQIEGVDAPLDVTPRPDGRWTVRHGAATTTASAARTIRSIWTGSGGAATEWQAASGAARVRHGGASIDALRAPMSATVVRVHVAAGDAVAEGDALVVVEAMKMEMPIRAPHAGIVRAVHCREGELVAAGAVLVELE